jgi:hypothetical protein
MQARQVALRREILEALMNGATNIRQIQNVLNETIERRNEQKRQQKGVGQAEPKVPYKYVQEQLASIREAAKERGITNYQELAADMDEQYKGLIDEANKGFDDLQTAFDMASMYFTSLPVDPRTRGKFLTVGKSGKMVFNPPEDFENYNRDTLAGKRMTGVLTEPVKEPISEEPTEMMQDIEEGEVPVDEPEEMAPPEDAENLQDEQGIDEEDLEQHTKAESVSSMSRIEKIDQPQNTLDGILSRTITNLVRIAEDLDASGKGSAAEEIHKVIRKYQSRIK